MGVKRPRVASFLPPAPCTVRYDQPLSAYDLADLLHDSLTVLGHIVDFKSLQIVPSLAQALAFGKTTKLSAGWVGTQTTFFLSYSTLYCKGPRSPGK